MRINKNFIALIPCAGSGSRFGGNIPKQYSKIGNKTVLEHTLLAFLQVELITKIVVVVNPNDDYIFSLNKDILSKIEILTCGGDTRAQSVLNGLNALNTSDDSWILVHDAARCCIEPKLITKQISVLSDELVGGILAIPAKDTVKIVRNNIIKQTLNRDNIYLAQTPQMFRYGILKQALNVANLDAITDEASAIEGLDLAVKIVLGSPKNIKITHKEDVNTAVAIMESIHGSK